jgi:hypothetical protein
MQLPYQSKMFTDLPHDSLQHKLLLGKELAYAML